jgi:hypothetical protein
VTVRGRLLVALALVVAAVLASPASGADPLKRYTVEGAGASFSIPRSWIAFSGRQIRTRAFLDQVARENPRLELYLRSFTQVGTAVKFVALDRTLRDGFATNANVVSLTAPTNISFAQYREVILGQLRTLTQGAKITDSEVVIDGNRALRFGYRFRLTLAGRTITVQTLQLAFLRGRRSTVFTYTTTPRSAAAYARTFDASAKSIRFGS